MESLLELAKRVWPNAQEADYRFYGQLVVRGPVGILLSIQCRSEQAARNVLVALAKEDA